MTVISFYFLGVFDGFENSMMDFHFGRSTSAPSGDLIIVEIDAKSLRELNVWPWPRNYYATVLNNLMKTDLKKIAFDIDFSSQSLKKNDLAFEKALKNSNGTVILPSFRQYKSGQKNIGDVIESLPLPQFKAHTSIGSVNVFPDHDGYIREFYIANSIDDSYRLSLIASLTERSHFSISKFYIDYSIDPNLLPKISFIDLYNGNYDPDVFKGKHVLIGATAIELGDKIATPSKGVLPGIIIQALAYETIIQDRMITRTSPFIVVIGCFILTFFILPIIYRKPWKTGLTGYALLSLSILLSGYISQRYFILNFEIIPHLAAIYFSLILVIIKIIRKQAISIIREKMENSYREDLMKQVVHDSFDGIVITDQNGRIQVCNQSARKYLCLNQINIDNLSIYDFIPNIVDNIRHMQDDNQLIKQEKITQHTTKLEREIEDDNGIISTIELVISKSTMNKLIGKTGKETMRSHIFTFTFRDITVEKNARIAQENATNEIIAANRAKTEFLANMSHELRTPLNAIIGFSDIIMGQMFGAIENEKYVEYSEDINKSGKHLLSIVNDILDVSKIETGHFELNEGSIDPYEILKSCENIIKGWMSNTSKKLTTDYAEDLPYLIIDARLIKQIILNLLSNAVKFTANDGIININAQIDKKGDFYIEVTDDGIGIKTEEIQKVTDAFYQVDGSLARTEDGTGLGLHLVSKFIELHDGKLSIKSIIGEGSQVRVTIPSSRFEEEEDHDATYDQSQKTVYFSKR